MATIQFNNLDRYWSKLRKTDSCWLWTASLASTGYGQIYRPVVGGPTVERTHRLGWMIAHNRVVPDGYYVCHSCDVKACSNPDHLWIGTQRENMVDAFRKGLVRSYARPTPEFCKNGHAFSTENTYVKPNGYKACKACSRARTRIYYLRRRAVARHARL